MTLAQPRIIPTVALIAVAAIWAGTFVMVKDAIASYPTFSFLGWRFWIAVVVFVLIFPKAITALRRDTLGVGVLAGIFLCLGFIFQTWGLEQTTASRAAFITGMFVVITPVLQALILRKIPGAMVIAGALLAVAGLWLLSGGSAGQWGQGDTRVLLSAFAYSGHMIVLGGLGRRHEVAPLTFVQLVTTATVCSGLALAIDPISIPSGTSVWVAILFTGILASAVAFAVQTYAQRHISPARTALILICEPALGGLFGWFAGDTFTGIGIIGAGLILLGMISSEFLSIAKLRKGEVIHQPSIEGPSVAMLKQSE